MHNKLSLSSIKRGIYVSYAVALLDFLAVSLFLPLISRQIRDLGASPFLVGLVGSVYGAIQLFSSPIIGWGSDMYGRKVVIIVCIAASAFAYLLQGGAANLAVFIIARSIAGLFKHTQTIGKAVVTDLSPHEKSYVIGNFNAFGSMGFIIGPTIGSHLVEYENGFQDVCYLAAGIFLINIVLIFTMIPETNTKTEVSYQNIDSNENKSDEKPNDMTRFTIMAILSLRLLFSFATLVPRANLALTLEAKYDASVVSQGYLNSLQALVSTLTGFAVGPIVSVIYKENHRAMVIHGGFLKMISLIGLYLAPTFRLAGIALMVQSGVDPFLRVGITALSLGHTQDPGAILGLGQTATSLSRMLAPFAAGVAQTFSDDGPAFLGAWSAFIGLLSSIFLVRSNRKPIQKTLRL